MKQILFFLTLILGFAFSAQAAGVATPTYGNNTITVSKTIGEPSTKKATAPKQTVFAKAWQRIKSFSTNEIVFYVLAIITGPIGLHRLVAGSSLKVVLCYIGIALLIGLLFWLLNFLTLGLLGGALFWLLPIFDIIKAATSGVSHFEGNEDVFAAFK